MKKREPLATTTFAVHASWVKHIREILALVWRLVSQLLRTWLGKVLKGILLKAVLYVSVFFGIIAALVILIRVLTT